MLDDTAVLLGHAWQKAWDVHKGHDWNVERIAEPNESRGFERRVDVEEPKPARAAAGE